jgi:hypothetical protein
MPIGIWTRSLLDRPCQRRCWLQGWPNKLHDARHELCRSIGPLVLLETSQLGNIGKRNVMLQYMFRPNSLVKTKAGPGPGSSHISMNSETLRLPEPMTLT